MDRSPVARPDRNNDLAVLHLDIDQEINNATDAKSKAILIRRLKRALAGDQPDNPRRRPPISGASPRQRDSDDN